MMIGKFKMYGNTIWTRLQKVKTFGWPSAQLVAKCDCRFQFNHGPLMSGSSAQVKLPALQQRNGGFGDRVTDGCVL